MVTKFLGAYCSSAMPLEMGLGLSLARNGQNYTAYPERIYDCTYITIQPNRHQEELLTSELNISFGADGLTRRIPMM